MNVRKLTPSIELGNVLFALSTVGLLALGVIDVSIPVLAISAGIFVVVGFFGKYIDEVEDDRERLEKYEEFIKESLQTKGDDNS